MQNNQELPEWDKDLQERVAGFNAALQPLLGKYELGLLAIPFVDRDGTIKAQPQLISVRQAPGSEKADPEAKVSVAE